MNQHRRLLPAAFLSLIAAVALLCSPAWTFAAPGQPNMHGPERSTASGTAAHDVQHDAVAGEHAAAGEHEAQAPLLPSTLEEGKEFFLTPAIWTLVIFTIMLVILYPMAWKPVLAGLKKREARIRNDIAQAEESSRKAAAQLKQYNDQLAGAESRIRDMLSKAQADGEKLATAMRMQAQQEAEEAKERAQRDIESSKNAAIREVYEQTATLATGIAEKILRRNLNADDQRELVKQSLDQLQTMK